MSYCISTVVRTTTGPDTCEVPASAAALAMVASFRPVSVDEEAGCFARAVLKAARPESPVRAKALLFATSRLAGFSVSVGLELDPEKVLDPSVIERFILCGAAGLTVATRRTLRTNLRFVTRHVPRPCPGAGATGTRAGQARLLAGRDRLLSRHGEDPTHRLAAHAPGRAHLPRGGGRVDRRRPTPRSAAVTSSPDLAVSSSQVADR